MYTVGGKQIYHWRSIVEMLHKKKKKNTDNNNSTHICCRKDMHVNNKLINLKKYIGDAY